MRGLHYLSQRVFTGYGYAAQRMVKALAQSGVAVEWTPMDPPPHLLPLDRPQGYGSLLDELVGMPVDHDVTCIHDLPESYPFLTRDGSVLLGHAVWRPTPFRRTGLSCSTHSTA